MTNLPVRDLRAAIAGPRFRSGLFWGLATAFPLLLLGWEFFRAGISMCAIALLALALWEGSAGGGGGWSPPQRLWRRLRGLGPAWWGPTLFVWMLLPSLANSDHLGEWAGRLQIKLPFLAMPVAFGLMPRPTRAQLHGLFALLLAAVALTNAGVGIYYTAHFDEIQDMISRSQPVPTPIHHIRFSLLSGISVLGGLEILRGGGFSDRRGLRWAVGVGTLFVAAMVHVLAVRTGMLALYGGLLAWGLAAAWHAKRYVWAIGTVALLALAPVAAYQLLPSVRAKVGLMLWNLERYRAGEIGQYSDTQRWASYEVGLAIGNRAPWLGCGIGDLDAEVDVEYARRFPDVKPMLPHNQWLFFFAACGVVGLLFALTAFFSPLFWEKKYQDPLFAGFFLLTTVSFMTETAIETAVGVGLTAFFLSLLMAARNPE